MGIVEDRKFTRQRVNEILTDAVGKTLGEVDRAGSKQFARTISNPKITGIAGDVIEQSVFGYSRDSEQQCDIEVDGIPIEIKTTGVRVPKSEVKVTSGKNWREYKSHFMAKEGISVTAVTLEPDIQRDFYTSHFWEKAENMLFVFYEYKSYEVVPAANYKDFTIVGFSFNKFSEEDQKVLRNDWELVRDYLVPFYNRYKGEERKTKLEGFTSILRPQLYYLELVPAYKRKKTGSFQNPRYRLKKTFIDSLVKEYFNRSSEENRLPASITGFAELDKRCRDITERFSGKTLAELKEELSIETEITTKSFTSLCIIKMFGGNAKKLEDIADFAKAGIRIKTITLTHKGKRTEDMKLFRVDFEEWDDRDTDFEESSLFNYFCEHSLLCPIFCENDSSDISKTEFKGFKRFAFDDSFIFETVRKTWIDSRHLVHTNQLRWEHVYNTNGEPIQNKSGTYAGAPNLPKSQDYIVFFRGSAANSSKEGRSEVVNGIRMLPQYIWLKGSYISEKLSALPYL